MGTVWVIDDDALVRRTCERALRREGRVTVRSFASAEAATAVLRESKAPDGVIVDERMPGQGGLDWFNENRERLRRTRVLLLTGVADPELSLRAHLAKVHLLLKPVPPRFFAAFVAEVERDVAAGKASRTEGSLAKKITALQGRPPLSARQIQVVTLYTQGLRRREIAAELSLKPATIKKHFTALLRRTGFADMRELLLSLSRD